MSKSPEVEAWFAKKRHPQEALMRKVRDVILKADKRVEECVKWSCPTFTFEGNLASLNPQAKKFVSVMFHYGAKIPGKHPVLQGGKGTAAFTQVLDAADLKKKAGGIAKVVKAWCEWKAGD